MNIKALKYFTMVLAMFLTTAAVAASAGKIDQAANEALQDFRGVGMD